MLAFILSKRVFPINVPRPNPDFDPTIGCFERIYGSPKNFFTSSGNPGPSSHTFILVKL